MKAKCLQSKNITLKVKSVKEFHISSSFVRVLPVLKVRYILILFKLNNLNQEEFRKWKEKKYKYQLEFIFVADDP